jgi:NPCBM/NEW2 domain
VITVNTPTAVYVSDFTPTAQTNGWGPYERNRSNGEQGAADGRVITLNGVTYGKGLGCHAASDLRFNLNAQYKTFLTDIGLDDEVGTNGSVIFQIWLDGVKVYDSGVMRGATATKQATLDVTGKRELRLVITNGGDNLNYDHADWANARLVR